MKASAGSGKTFNLAKTYIRLLLSGDDPHAYRHILAVTFTNKATEEMKSRILKELHLLAKEPEKSPYFSDLLPLFGSSEKLGERSSKVLCAILHDYSAFAVSTIDRFFQQTLKAFSREIGQFASYQVEIDTASLVDETVDRVLDSLSEDEPALLKWLTRNVMESIQEGKRYNLEKNLKGVARNLKSGEHRAKVEEFGVDEDAAYSKENLAAMKKKLLEVTAGFRKSVVEAASAFVKGCGAEGLGQEDFSGKTFNVLYKISEQGLSDKIPEPAETLRRRCGDFSTWFRKAEAGRYSHLEGILMPLLQNYCALFGERFTAYSTAQKIAEHLSELGIAADLYREFNSLMKEKNVLCLEESNFILRNIIDGSDAPFVYEKLGVRFDHFLLDEFQDTSRIQWENFRPLLKESASKGKENLLVGDVKQSIYRWRGSEWKMMASEVQQEFDDSEVETLDSNYRSLRSIVEFNNGFFEYSAAALDRKLGEHEGMGVADIYSDASQLVKCKDRAEGSVEAVFCRQEDELDAVVEAISRARSAGARHCDITILVRTNKQGSEIALYLMSKGIRVISDDSLHLKSSPLVRQVVSLLSTVGNPDDSIGSFLASEMGIDVEAIDCLSLLDLCEHLFRVLRTRDSKWFESQTQYVQSFMDFVQDYASINGNSLDSFLRAWNDADPRISSPADPDSVVVMTVHKSKGLEFPYVIIPFVEANTLFQWGFHWAHPDVSGTELEDVADSVFHVSLLDPKNDRTLFHQESFNEMYMQYIDNINTFYVALTRAAKGLCMISAMPDDKFVDAVRSGDAPDLGDFSKMLFAFLHSDAATGFCSEETTSSEDGQGGGRLRFCKGELFDFETFERKGKEVDVFNPGYPSFPLNPEPGDAGTDVRERGRLKFSADSIPFFCDEAKASASARMNGTVMHDILAQVNAPSDLVAAVKRAVASGNVDSRDEESCMEMLSKAIVSHPEWFPEDGAGIASEVSLIDSDGRVYRPDRVVSRNGRLTIIDYKFGEKNPRYRAQVERYADIYARMGHVVEQTAIWYVPTGEIE